MLLIILFLLQRGWKTIGYLAPRFLLMCFSLLFLAGLGELYFRHAYAESGWGFTLAYQNWEDRYWETNSLGFRDREWKPEDWAGKQTIMVMGDSFSAGWGIKNPEDRYPNVLADFLGEDYAVVLVARPGGTPPRELEWAKSHPLQNPNVIIYQYYLNDIDDAALSINDYWQARFPRPPHWIDQESHLANFLYWRLAPLVYSVNAADGQSYWEWNYATYQNHVIFEIHRQELQAVMDFAEERGSRLIVVIFPNQQDPVGSIRYVDAVATVFQEQGYTEILKLFDEAAAWQAEDAMVSARDAHPSVAYHHRVAQLLYQQFFAD